MLPLNPLRISHLLLQLTVLPISYLLLLLLDVLLISHPNRFLQLQLLYLETRKNGSKARWLKIKWKKKMVNALSDKNNTNKKKGRVLQDKDKTKKKKPIWLKNENGKMKKSLWWKKTLEADLLLDLHHASTPPDIFHTGTEMNDFKIINIIY